MISEREPPSPNNNFILNLATFPNNAIFVAINAIYIVCVSQGQNFRPEFLTFFNETKQTILVEFSYGLILKWMDNNRNFNLSAFHNYLHKSCIGDLENFRVSKLNIRTRM